jgi:DNA ligase D-like protein (predicted ligase)
MSKRAMPLGSSSGLRFVEFQLPSLVKQPPTGDRWLHEIKYDGYRTQLVVQDGAARAYTRNGLDWTTKYVPIVSSAASLPAKSAILDGEVVVLDENGHTDFGKLRSAISWEPERLIFVAFDLLHFDGEELRFRPLIERRTRLAGLIGDRTEAIQFSQHVEGNGPAFFAQADRLGMEGIVSKRADAPYRGGRANSWLKVKCFEESIYEVAGVLREPGRAAIAYMVTPDRERRYVGGAFIALNREMRERLWERVKASARPVTGAGARPGTEWLKPGAILGRVRHLKGEDKLRHATLSEIEVTG